MRNRLPHIAFLLFAAQLLLMLVSWLLAAAIPTSGVRSLLSSEGLRWLLGHFSDMLGTPVLLCLLLLLIAYGSLKGCGILQFKSSYRQSRALIITLLLLVVYVGVIVLLGMIPHAVLLSATGSLWPSPFSAAIVPLFAFGITLLSTVYGYVAGRYCNMSDVYQSLINGIRSGAPLLLFYVLLGQLYYSLLFILP
ncbi:MAG: AbgT family transporter [Prevotella sp.]|nr:AbgT family transporter [Prevotella sp.]